MSSQSFGAFTPRNTLFQHPSKESRLGVSLDKLANPRSSPRTLQARTVTGANVHPSKPRDDSNEGPGRKRRRTGISQGIPIEIPDDDDGRSSKMPIAEANGITQ